MSKANGKHNTAVISLPPWPVFSFLTPRNLNIIREWLAAEKVSKTQIADFQAKIDAYERGGPDLNPGLIVGPIAKSKHVFKMKIKGNKGHVQLRPMVCFGPPAPHEVTMLLGAIEKDGKLTPSNYKEKALDNRETLIADATRRRRERID
jgi:hypothetical protein